MLKHSEQLLLEGIFGYSVEVIETCLCSPANVKGGSHVGTGPIEYLLNLVPVFYFLIRKQLNRGSRYDHSIPFLFFEHCKILVKHQHVFDRRIFGRVASEPHKVDFYLEWCIGEQPDEVCFGRYLEWHQIEDDDLQGANLLRMSASLVHHEDVLFLQKFYCRKLIGNS